MKWANLTNNSPQKQKKTGNKTETKKNILRNPWLQQPHPPEDWSALKSLTIFSCFISDLPNPNGSQQPWSIITSVVHNNSLLCRLYNYLTNKICSIWCLCLCLSLHMVGWTSNSLFKSTLSTSDWLFAPSYKKAKYNLSVNIAAMLWDISKMELWNTNHEANTKPNLSIVAIWKKTKFEHLITIFCEFVI